MNDFGFSVEKLVDNFLHHWFRIFSEMGRENQMQQQGSKILGDINTVLRSVLTLLYDLKEFRIRLQTYDDLKLKDKEKSNAASFLINRYGWIK
jgi:hypothetical protein